MFFVAIVCQRIQNGIWSRAEWASTGQAAIERERPLGGNPFAGIFLVLKSPYLLGIATFVILLAAVNTFLYFEQLRLVSERFSDSAERTRVFSNIDFTVQSLTLGLQLFATGRLASRWGIGVLLTAVPILMMLGLGVLAAANTFAVFVVIIVLRRVTEYSFVRPGREMLFSRVDTETKYKAKNFIDVPVYRGGDALVAQVTGGFQSAGISAAAVGAAVAAAWAVNGWWLASRKEHKVAEQQSSAS
jgi:AAA family ATP:ADP antiporter